MLNIPFPEQPTAGPLLLMLPSLFLSPGRASGPGLTRIAPLILLVLLAGAGCSRSPDDQPHATHSLAGGRLVVVGARPEVPTEAHPETKGFFEEARWDEELQTLQCRGWAPLDTRRESVRFFLRDPHDRLLLEGTPLFTPRERPDVAQAHPDKPDARHWGFTASVRLKNLPASPVWLQTLELYCLADQGEFFRLTPLFAPTQQTWLRPKDGYEAVLMYATPQVNAAEGTQGSLDVCEPYPDDQLHLTGWAPFDGGSPKSTLIIQLAPELAPATLVSAGWLPREDVRAAVDPARESLDRSGFELLLRINGTLADLKKRGALRLWAIHDDGTAVEVGLPVLR